MAKTQIEINSRTCPHCQASMFRVDDWKPPQGFDPRMSKFICPNCNDDYYFTPKNPKFPTAPLDDRFENPIH